MPVAVGHRHIKTIASKLDNMDTTTSQSIINSAFENHLNSYLSKDARQEIADNYGHEIADAVKAIYDDALNCPVDWRVASVDDGLRSLGDLLSQKYPWLSEQARLNIVHAFVMEWK